MKYVFQVPALVGEPLKLRELNIPSAPTEITFVATDNSLIDVDIQGKLEWLANEINLRTTQLFDKAVAEKMAPELMRQDEKIDRLVEAVRQLTDIVQKIKTEGR